jgi:dTDP-4-dehydrorhamnose reductase
VFDGEKEGPYLPADKTNPVNTYGASKLAGEMAIRQIWDRFYIVRTSWLYGKNGRNFVYTILDLANRKNEIRVVEDQIGAPTWTVNLARVLSKVIRTGQFGIYHATDETDGGISWHRFAEEIVKLANLDCRVVPVKSAEFPRPAKRPVNSVLDLKYVKMILNRELPSWKDSIENFLQSQIIE